MKALRINRFLSSAGLGSRRQVEEFVREGRVRLNGVTVKDLSTRIEPETDRVEFDGSPVQAQPAGRTLIYHKPRGVVCSFSRQGDAPSLSEALPAELLEGRLFHVGRLDRDSSGLLLLSDDGDLAHALLHPSRPVWKRYRVLLDAPLAEESLVRFREGKIVLHGRACAPARIEALERGGEPLYRVELREGRNRQIRRMVEVLGRRVRSLHREGFGPLQLGDLPEGALRPLRDSELEELRRLINSGGD